MSFFIRSLTLSVLIISPVYSATNVDFLISSLVRTPHPLFFVLKISKYGIEFFCMTLLGQSGPQKHLLLHSCIIFDLVIKTLNIYINYNKISN